MATLKTTSPLSGKTIDYSIGSASLWHRYVNYADKQKSQHMLWWLISLLVHCLLVPFIFLLAYTLNGPTILILGISMVLFFINVVANMSGASTRFTILAFFASLAIHGIMTVSLFL